MFCRRRRKCFKKIYSVNHEMFQTSVYVYMLTCSSLNSIESLCGLCQIYRLEDLCKISSFIRYIQINKRIDVYNSFNSWLIERCYIALTYVCISYMQFDAPLFITYLYRALTTKCMHAVFKSHLTYILTQFLLTMSERKHHAFTGSQ